MGRGAHLLRDITVGASIRIRGVFGHFLLQESTNPKIFIATGTGLAPIYNMIQSLVISSKAERSLPKISLYFTVATQEELFYTDRLRSIPNLDLHIHITREDIE